MALASTIVFDVRSGGSDTNGGGFKTGASGTNYVFPTSNPQSVTGMTSSGAGAVVLCATASSTWVGNVINITAGTNFTQGRYEIISVVASTSFTVDSSCTTGAGSGGAGTIGGALASPGRAAAIATVAGQKVYVKSGTTYTLTSGTANVDGGRLSLTGGVLWEGYAATQGDMGTAPTISAGALTGISLVTLNGSGVTNSRPYLVNFIIDGNGGAGNTGVTDSSSYRGTVYLVRAKSCLTAGFSGATRAVKCSAISCGTGFSSCRMMTYCYAGYNTTGFITSNECLSHCIAYGNSGDGFNSGGFGDYFVACTSAANGGDGFDVSAFDLQNVINCISYNNTGYGFKMSTGMNLGIQNCAYGSNGSGNFQTTPLAEYGGVSLSSNPFAASGSMSSSSTLEDAFTNLAPTSASGLRGAGVAAYTDIGAAQHQDAGGSGAAGGSYVFAA